MNEQLPSPLLQQDVSRRAVLQTGAVAAVLTVAPEALTGLLEDAGRLYDRMTSPENIVKQPIVALEPREHNTPSVHDKERGEPTATDAIFSRRGDSTTLRFASNDSLWAEHTSSPVSDQQFTSRGTAIITTAEGLQDGKQEYCKLFFGDKQAIAVGYEGGLYIYEPTLTQGGDGTSGEWVRLLTHNGDDKRPSHAVTSWDKAQAASPDRMLIQEVVDGTNALRQLGYKPWAAVLPSTQMPGMKRVTLAPDTCAENSNEVAQHEGDKWYFITKQGDIVDIDHLWAKAGETLSLFVELYYQHLTGEGQPTAHIAYSEGSDAAFEFAVHPDAITPENLLDTTYAVMNAETMLMEGISQQYTTEHMPFAPEHLGGLNPEDLFSNSLGTVGMLALIRSMGLMQKLEGPLRALHAKYPQADGAEMRAAIDEVIESVKPSLVSNVATVVANSHGVRPQRDTQQLLLARGVYHLVPTKATEADGATPTLIDLKRAGVRPDNPKSKFKPTHVPAMETGVERLLTSLTR